MSALEFAAKDVLSSVVGLLVDRPEKIKISTAESSESLVISIIAAPDDISKVVGRGGRSIQSIQQLFSSYGAKNKKKIMVLLLD